MNELRWILLALGVLFLLGLWWWETRRQRQAADHSAALRPPDPFAEALEPSRPAVRRAYEADEGGLPEEPAAVDEPEVFEPARDTPETRAESPYTVPLMVQRIEPSLGDAAAAVTVEPPTYIPPATDDDPADAVPGAETTVTRENFLIDLPPTSEPITQPLAVEDERAEPLAEPPPARTPAREKIVTIRLAAPPLERFDGPTLVRALEAAGLELGRFSIFHRHGSDGSEVFSVASLVEPGTFDLSAIEGRRFPGVSIFAVLRKPEEASHTLEDMFGTARKLANELQGSLQDERGAPLSSLRMTELRADVIAWQRSCAAS